jgi:hypothetical protein
MSEINDRGRLTVDLLLAKLICEPKSGFIGVEFHTDSNGNPKSTMLFVERPDGTKSFMWVWDGFDHKEVAV